MNKKPCEVVVIEAAPLTAKALKEHLEQELFRMAAEGLITSIPCSTCKAFTQYIPPYPPQETLCDHCSNEIGLMLKASDL